MRGTPHAHICIFLHEDDKMKTDADKIDQMMWAEIPIDADSNESEEFLKQYRKEDDDRPRRWKGNDDINPEGLDHENMSNSKPPTDCVTFHFTNIFL